jgi:hypothetical protein
VSADVRAAARGVLVTALSAVVPDFGGPVRATKVTVSLWRASFEGMATNRAVRPAYRAWPDAVLAASLTRARWVRPCVPNPTGTQISRKAVCQIAARRNAEYRAHRKSD